MPSYIFQVSDTLHLGRCAAARPRRRRREISDKRILSGSEASCCKYFKSAEELRLVCAFLRRYSVVPSSCARASYSGIIAKAVRAMA